MSELRSQKKAYSNISLVNTKFNIPKPLDHQIHRNWLVNQLDDAVKNSVRLILLSAPPGYGKTTLLAEWMEQTQTEGQDIRFLWLTLDEFDNDFRRFIVYLLTAIKRAFPELSREIEIALNPEQDLSSYDILAFLVNLLSQVETYHVIIFEDYHLIENSATHQLLNKLLDYLPQKVTLVFASRMDLPFSISRYRSADQMLELRAADLKFSENETADFLLMNGWDSLSKNQIEAVFQRTEGWPASLQLIVLAGRGDDKPDQSINSFSGNQRLLADYFTDEVLNTQPSDVQEFLLRTSILKFFNVDLCREVTQLENVSDILNQVLEGNLFLVALDNQGIWFRYHRLFSDLLQHKLKTQSVAENKALHARAGQWYYTNGYLESALDHAILSEDFHFAVEWIAPYLSELWEQGRTDTIQSFTERIPESERYDSNELSLMYIRSLCQSGKIQKAKVCLQTSNLENRHLSRQEAGELEYIKAELALYSGDSPSTIRYLENAINQISDDDVDWRPAAYTLLGAALGWRGQLPESTAAYRKAVELGQRWDKAYFSLEAGFRLASNLYQMGKLQDAMQIIQQMLQYAENQKLEELPVVGTFWALKGTIFCKQNLLTEAADAIQAGIRIVESGNQIVHSGYSYLNAINVSLSTGDTTAVGELIRRTEALSSYSPLPDFIRYWIDAAKIRYYLLLDDIEQARIVGEEHFSILDESIEMIKFELYFALIRLAMVDCQPPFQEEDFDSELLCLNRLKSTAIEGGLQSKLVQVLVLEANLRHALHQVDQVKPLMLEALSIAAGEKMVRNFIEEGTTLLPYIQEVIRNTHDEVVIDFSRSILEQQDGKPSRKNQLLSERENEILAYLPSHLSEKEIAETLIVSSSTIHTHIKNIYQKLGVHTRSEAVEKSRTLGLID